MQQKKKFYEILISSIIGGGIGADASPSRGRQGGRFLGEKLSSFNQYRTMLAYS